MRLARVIDAAGGIDGRVKMQKIVYLLKAMRYDLPFDDFRIRQLGPFSRAVACSADMLTDGGFIREKTKHAPDSDGEPIVRYSYRVRPTVARLVRKHFDVPAPSGRPTLDEAARYLNAYDGATLEVTATRLYLVAEGRFRGSALDAELSRLKGFLANWFQDADRLLCDLCQHRWL